MFIECRHIMPTGRRCHSPALSGKPYCYFHIKLHRPGHPAGRQPAEPPAPSVEDMRGIQSALGHALHTLESPYVDTHRAGVLLYGLHLAAHIAGRISASDASDVVRDFNEKGKKPASLLSTAANVAAGTMGKSTSNPAKTSAPTMATSSKMRKTRSDFESKHATPNLDAASSRTRAE